MTLVEWQQKFRTVEDVRDSRNNGGPPGLYALGVDMAQRGLSIGRIGKASTCRMARLTAGTVLHRSKGSLPIWFLAIYLMVIGKRGVAR